MLEDSLSKWAEQEFGIKIANHHLDKAVKDAKTIFEENQVDLNTPIEALKIKKHLVYNQMVDLITVQESYFFRDQAFFSHMKFKKIPDLINEKIKANQFEINIWSAGCSFGEEIYTFIFILDELLPNKAQWKLTFWGSDINALALQRAKKGLFTSNNLRSTPDKYIEKYFTKEDKTFLLKPEVTSKVNFIEHNLNSNYVPKVDFFDLIICRNAFIYLTEDSVLNALNTFEKALNDKGELFLGPSDFVRYIPHSLTISQASGIFYYTKSPTESRVQARPDIKDKTYVSYADKQRQRTSALQSIEKLLCGGKFKEALIEVNAFMENDERPSGIVFRYKSEALIGLGDSTSAVFALDKAIRMDKRDAKSLFLKGLCELDKNRNDQASELFEKALAIRPNFPEANYYLALNMLSGTEKSKGIEHLKLAISQARKMDKSANVMASSETMFQFSEGLRRQLDFYEANANG